MNKKNVCKDQLVCIGVIWGHFLSTQWYFEGKTNMLDSCWMDPMGSSTVKNTTM